MAFVSIPGASSKVMLAMTTEWQTCALIAGKIDFPPDAVCRFKLKEKKTEHNAKVTLTARALLGLLKVNTPKIERRINPELGVFEYRLVHMVSTDLRGD
jgi:hypothetical protein